MAAYDDVAAAMEPWVTSWMSEAFRRDSKALTMALQKSLASSDDHSEFLPVFDTPAVTPAVSGSEPESTAVPVAVKRKREVAVACGKMAKRKSRASKRTQTTFITADPANFRQMVQQVTGVRFAGGSTVVKPEPMRAGVNGGGGRLPLPLPTLDTSAFLYDRQYHLEVVGPMCYGGDVAGGGGGGGGFDSYTTSTTSFPTLESWKVM